MKLIMDSIFQTLNKPFLDHATMREQMDESLAHCNTSYVLCYAMCSTSAKQYQLHVWNMSLYLISNSRWKIEAKPHTRWHINPNNITVLRRMPCFISLSFTHFPQWYISISFLQVKKGNILLFDLIVCCFFNKRNHYCGIASYPFWDKIFKQCPSINLFFVVVALKTLFYHWVRGFPLRIRELFFFFDFWKWRIWLVIFRASSWGNRIIYHSISVDNFVPKSKTKWINTKFFGNSAPPHLYVIKFSGDSDNSCGFFSFCFRLTKSHYEWGIDDWPDILWNICIYKSNEMQFDYFHWMNNFLCRLYNVSSMQFYGLTRTGI